MTRPIVVAAFMLAASIAVLVLSVAVVVWGCSWAKPACAVIDAAADGCQVLRYLGPDGGVQEVRVTRAELAAFGSETAAKHALAGCDAGPCKEGP